MHCPMNCTEFRNLYNRYLDGRKSSPLPTEAVLHGRNCSTCGSYASAMVRVDDCLREIPDVPFPEELLAFSGAAGVHFPGPPGELSPRPGRGAAIALPAFVIWSISLFIPLPWQFAAQLLLVSGSMVLLAVTSLSPGFIARLH
jgi:hypothetical protein